MEEGVVVAEVVMAVAVAVVLDECWIQMIGRMSWRALFVLLFFIFIDVFQLA